MLSQRNIYSV